MVCVQSSELADWNGLSRSACVMHSLLTSGSGSSAAAALRSATILARCSGVILSVTSLGSGGMPLKRMMEVISHKPSLTLSLSAPAPAALSVVSKSAATAAVFSVFMAFLMFFWDFSGSSDQP